RVEPRQVLAAPVNAVGRAIVGGRLLPWSERARARERRRRAGAKVVGDLVVRTGDQPPGERIARDRRLVLLVLRELQSLVGIEQASAGHAGCRLGGTGAKRERETRRNDQPLHFFSPFAAKEGQLTTRGRARASRPRCGASHAGGPAARPPHARTRRLRASRRARRTERAFSPGRGR